MYVRSRILDEERRLVNGSVSRFYEKPRLGMSAREYRARGKGQRIRLCSSSSPLGTVLIAATKNGLCSVKLGDDPGRLRRLLAEEFSRAQLAEKDMWLATVCAERPSRSAARAYV